MKNLPPLYTIIDSSYIAPANMGLVCEELIAGGAGIIQLRGKSLTPGELLEAARTIRALTEKAGVLFIVNDNIKVAIASRADGVHIGQDDLPLAEARRSLGPDKIIGLSTHSVEEVLLAKNGRSMADRAAAVKAANGALGGGRPGGPNSAGTPGTHRPDYISLGPIFETRTKKDAHPVVGLDLLRKVTGMAGVPVVAIGGIGVENLDKVFGAGAASVAIISEILSEEVLSGIITDDVRTFNGLIKDAQRKGNLNGKGNRERHLGA